MKSEFQVLKKSVSSRKEIFLLRKASFELKLVFYQITLERCVIKGKWNFEN